KEKDAITRTNDRDQTVDIDLQVKEKGRQQIQLNGGVSGFAGSFFGLEYSTNNLLGYGESLSIGVSGGNRQQFINFGFTEPYFMRKPISLGVFLYAQKYQFLGSGFNFSNVAGIFQQGLFGTSAVEAAPFFPQRSGGGVITFSPLLRFLPRRFREYSSFTRV